MVNSFLVERRIVDGHVVECWKLSRERKIYPRDKGLCALPLEKLLEDLSFYPSLASENPGYSYLEDRTGNVYIAFIYRHGAGIVDARRIMTWSDYLEDDAEYHRCRRYVKKAGLPGDTPCWKLLAGAECWRIGIGNPEHRRAIETCKRLLREIVEYETSGPLVGTGNGEVYVAFM